MRTATIIGHFAKKEEDLGGQTIKTKTITEELKKDLGQEQVLEIDTCGGIKTLLKVPLQVFHALESSKNVIIFPAENALQVYAPLLFIEKKIFFRKRKLHYVVIGGWLPNFIQDKKYLSKCLKQFDGIYVETNMMRNALKMQGFKNVFVMPNCKKLTVLSEKELVYSEGAPYKLCTFSRVSREKGIEDAINAVTKVNKDLGYTAFTLDIYGQVDAEQTRWFEDLKKNFSSEIQYRGVVSFEKSVDILKSYFALLFPTYYDGEGFAGTIIDAFSAGVPVIATDWRYNEEIINRDVGYVYPTGENHIFVDILKSVAINPSCIFEKKRICLQEAEKYRIDKATKVLKNKILK